MREHWSTRSGFILAALGSAIGLGTLWKFPYVTGDNGGGLFVLSYIFFTFFLGIPLFIGELLLGRLSQRGPVGTFLSLSGESTPWRFTGWLATLSSFLILTYYPVVAGWGLNYLMLSLNQFYEKTPVDKISSIFEVLFKSGDISLFWAFVFLLIVFGVVLQGVRKGIEFWSRILTVALVVLLVVLLCYALSLSGLKEAVLFLFRPKMKLSGLLDSLGLSLFTLSLAQGIILTYGSYSRTNEDLPKVSFIVGLLVCLISIMVVLTIFPVIFTFHLPPQGGAGLIFKTLPLLFSSLPAPMILSTFFFTLFTFTALTSAIALMEVLVANLIDLYGLTRKKAAIFSTLAVLIACIPSALSGSEYLFKKWSFMYGMNFFTTIDTLVSVWFLPIGALLISLYIGWHFKKEFLRQAFNQYTTLSYLFPVWFFIIKWVLPVAIFFILLDKGGFLSSKG